MNTNTSDTPLFTAFFSLILGLSTLFLTACATTNTNTGNSDKAYRVLLTSDIHYTDQIRFYHADNAERIQAWVDTVKAEHAAEPFDLILILGDVSLDYWINGGAVLKTKHSDVTTFVRDYVSQLPADVPHFIVPGNHEQYGPEQWKAITGNGRFGTVTLGNNTFIMLDSFSQDLAPDHDHDGKYAPLDVAYIQQQIDAAPDNNIFLCAHYVDIAKESPEFKELLAKNPNIITIFQGHTHRCSVIQLDETCGNKTICQTGNFSYNNESDKPANFWGLRELVITPKNITTRYIIPKNTVDNNGKPIYVPATITNEKSFLPAAANR